MTRNVRSASRWLAAGRAGDYMRGFDDVVRAGDALVLWCRVSSETNAAHLRDQEAALRNAAADCRVAAVVRYIGPGYDHPYSDGPCWYAAVARAAAIARQNGAKLVATEADRFIRDAGYYLAKRKDRALPRDSDYRTLAEAAGGVPLVTLAPPDATPGENKSQQIKRGHGGRPRLTEEELLRRAVYDKLNKLPPPTG